MPIMLVETKDQKQHLTNSNFPTSSNLNSSNFKFPTPKGPKILHEKSKNTHPKTPPTTTRFLLKGKILGGCLGMHPKLTTCIMQVVVVGAKRNDTNFLTTSKKHASTHTFKTCFPLKPRMRHQSTCHSLLWPQDMLKSNGYFTANG
jgi:hypothetical protein